MNILGAIFAKFGSWILAALFFLGMIFSFFSASKKVGKAEGQAEAAKQKTADNEAIAVRQVDEAREAAKTEVAAIEAANNAQREVNSLEPDSAAQQLRDEWSRD